MMKQNFQERRKHSRLLLSLPMQIQWANEKGMTFIESCKSTNVSTGGVYYKSREGLPLETDAIVTFDLPFSFKMLRTRGKVVRIEGVETEEKGIALKFLEELKFSTPYTN
jgi:c-di-GMP-binding flagellar brake protein YcgR